MQLYFWLDIYFTPTKSCPRSKSGKPYSNGVPRYRVSMAHEDTENKTGVGTNVILSSILAVASSELHMIHVQLRVVSVY